MSKTFSRVEWAKGNNIYEVNIRQYTKEGTFNAFKAHLPRLRDMGVGVLWLMPITPISKKGRLGTLGSYYACSSYVGINPEFGTMNDFKELVDEAHSLGFKLIIDWVANHTGLDHEWTVSSPKFYRQDANGNFTERNGWKDVIDLDFGNTEMREALINAMRFWVKEFDIDGFRCDMAHLVPLDFWREARLQCDSIKPLFWLAECEDAAYHEVYDVSYAWQWMHTTEKFMKGQTGISEIYNVLHSYSQYPYGAIKLFFTSNHDENSWNGTEYEKYGSLAKAFAVFCCTWGSGMPLIYSGQEMPNNKRLEFFNKDEIQWGLPIELHEFYKKLLSVHQTDAVAKGETFILPIRNEKLMAYFRKYDNEVVLVIINYGNDSKVHLDISHDWLKGDYVNIFSGIELSFGNKENFELMAHEFLIYKSKSKFS